MRSGGLVGIALLAALAGCANKPPPRAPAIRINEDPYPSTYVRYPGVPTLVRNATIFDGEGGRIDNGSVLLADGKIVGLYPPLADFPFPDGTVTIDGTGKFITPGIIDVHSHLGDYPSPG